MIRVVARKPGLSIFPLFWVNNVLGNVTCHLPPHASHMLFSWVGSWTFLETDHLIMGGGEFERFLKKKYDSEKWWKHRLFCASKEKNCLFSNWSKIKYSFSPPLILHTLVSFVALKFACYAQICTFLKQTASTICIHLYAILEMRNIQSSLCESLDGSLLL